MVLYKQRIPTVDAVQFTGGQQNATTFITRLAALGVVATYEPAVTANGVTTPERLRIQNPDSTVDHAYVTDFVVRENGEFYVMTSVDFLAAYERA